ncbi:hypothetical protein WHT83_20925 [Aminobacter sp. P9b]|uniref:hypothetical protein n=1 Tax=Aminobacter sp. P9b TaxID=3133697 RepID=UPI003248A181
MTLMARVIAIPARTEPMTRLGKSATFVTALVIAACLSPFGLGNAHANCQSVDYVMDSNGKRHRVEYNCAGGSGSNDAAAIGLLGAGIGLLLQGLETPSAPDESDSLPRKPNAFDEIARQRKAKAERYQKTKKLETKAAVDSSLDPWADSPSKKAKKSDGRAPYADLSCVDIRRTGSGVSWDMTRLTNKCGFPVQVLTCYYDKGERQKCDGYKSGRWGTSDTIKVGSSVASVSSSKRPGFGVRYIVCNMSGITKHEELCLLPKG